MASYGQTGQAVVKGVVPLDLKRELQDALKPTGTLGRVGCDNESAAVRRALRELLDRASVGS